MGCTDYTLSGANVEGVNRSSQAYSGKIIYENAEAKTVGQISIKAPTVAAFNTDVTKPFWELPLLEQRWVVLPLMTA
ncbi:hypothetical protein KSK55_05865 [Methanospirillum purgamenti]|uniref:Uncharacterized protein n=1 Tax=Methanospirillum hungatei TaxID=2203 RepID=A0A8F5VMQ4_METHU|nr:hypothetical protein [Methanospirillum hungatei]QXO95911.1 hypothetical protein KSK55_05865 [Methanospirillum hungatei]